MMASSKCRSIIIQHRVCTRNQRALSKTRHSLTASRTNIPSLSPWLEIRPYPPNLAEWQSLHCITFLRWGDSTHNLLWLALRMIELHGLEGGNGGGVKERMPKQCEWKWKWEEERARRSPVEWRSSGGLEVRRTAGWQ